MKVCVMIYQISSLMAQHEYASINEIENCVTAYEE